MIPIEHSELKSEKKCNLVKLHCFVSWLNSFFFNFKDSSAQFFFTYDDFSKFSTERFTPLWINKYKKKFDKFYFYYYLLNVNKLMAILYNEMVDIVNFSNKKNHVLTYLFTCVSKYVFCSIMEKDYMESYTSSKCQENLCFIKSRRKKMF